MEAFKLVNLIKSYIIIVKSYDRASSYHRHIHQPHNKCIFSQSWPSSSSYMYIYRSEGMVMMVVSFGGRKSFYTNKNTDAHILSVSDLNNQFRRARRMLYLLLFWVWCPSNKRPPVGIPKKLFIKSVNGRWIQAMWRLDRRRFHGRFHRRLMMSQV